MYRPNSFMGLLCAGVICAGCSELHESTLQMDSTSVTGAQHVAQGQMAAPLPGCVTNPGTGNSYFIVNRKFEQKLAANPGSIYSDASHWTGNKVRWSFKAVPNKPLGTYFIDNVSSGERLQCAPWNSANTIAMVPTSFTGGYVQWTVESRGNGTCNLTCNVAGGSDATYRLALNSRGASPAAEKTTSTGPYWKTHRWHIASATDEDSAILNETVWLEKNSGEQLHVSNGAHPSYFDGAWHWATAHDADGDGLMGRPNGTDEGRKMRIYRNTVLGSGSWEKIKEFDVEENGKACTIHKHGPTNDYRIICKYMMMWKATTIDGTWSYDDTLQQVYKTDWHSDTISYAFDGKPKLRSQLLSHFADATWKLNGHSTFKDPEDPDHIYFVTASRIKTNVDAVRKEECKQGQYSFCSGGHLRFLAIYKFNEQLTDFSLEHFTETTQEAVWLFTRRSGNTKWFYVCGSESRGWRGSKTFCDAQTSIQTIKGVDTEITQVAFLGDSVDGSEILDTSFGTQFREFLYLGNYDGMERWVYHGNKYPNEYRNSDSNLPMSDYHNPNYGEQLIAPVVWAGSPPMPQPVFRMSWNPQFYDWTHSVPDAHGHDVSGLNHGWY